jgi:AcrR family transcriptional regulator
VHDIAASANINAAHLYHYFGSKEGLYTAALEEIYARIRAEEAKLALDRLPPIEAMKRLVAFTFGYYLDNPHFVAIINNENLYGGTFLKHSDKAVALNIPIIESLARLLARGAREGIFRPSIDPVDLYISITGLGYVYVSNRHTLGIIFDRDLMRPAAIRQRLATMTDMVLRYVCV